MLLSVIVIVCIGLWKKKCAWATFTLQVKRALTAPGNLSSLTSSLHRLFKLVWLNQEEHKKKKKNMQLNKRQ